eukprot:3456071-Alexandrium_andersonii.AAC.1
MGQVPGQAPHCPSSARMQSRRPRTAPRSSASSMRSTRVSQGARPRAGPSPAPCRSESTEDKWVATNG